VERAFNSALGYISREQLFRQQLQKVPNHLFDGWGLHLLIAQAQQWHNNRRIAAQ
jgi:hypothetical protein